MFGRLLQACSRTGHKSVKRLVDRFDRAIRGCADAGQLERLLAWAAAELGFDHYALLDHSSLERGTRGLVRMDNYPRSWVRDLVGSGLVMDDPVHLASRHSSSGFCWRDAHRLVPLGARHRAIFERSRRHGLGPGFTVPANVPGEPSASCSFAVRAGRKLPLERLQCAELVGAHALREARRFRSCDPAVRPRLSPRQVQCLRLVAMGKTDWEIARILGLSVETAHQYVKSARAAYETVSRTQLVVLGLRDRWISFEDVTPPNG